MGRVTCLAVRLSSLTNRLVSHAPCCYGNVNTKPRSPHVHNQIELHTVERTRGINWDGLQFRTYMNSAFGMRLHRLVSIWACKYNKGFSRTRGERKRKREALSLFLLQLQVTSQVARRLPGTTEETISYMLCQELKPTLHLQRFRIQCNLQKCFGLSSG